MENKEHTKFVDKIVEALKKSAIEIEEFRVQAALGKAEAQDKYEEAKKKFNLFIHESKFKIEVGKEKIDDINTKFDELRVQLALGKADTKDAFAKQKKQLLLLLHDIEVKIKTNKKMSHMYALVLVEIEKFKIHLDVLEDNFKDKKSDAKASFEKGKQEFNDYINTFKTKYSKKEETKWEHFQGEVSQAFSHLKMAFTKP
ncbi:DNA replication initiation control protein YabA [Lacinutrix sp. Bg11-31]|uniref:DNA replication initiation control protein YabA n=1 Tax=Lacinutrix sp. Bg11-31 TaxID=2057808 RepID=UPI000C3190DD|nr:DNA replication initiation control protein YabA [Lacinutrix sp. Bg11-31]AUC81211.1 hypothetical protein CW733_03310 [Lacinutrix sp. Bg11-31]